MRTIRKNGDSVIMNRITFFFVPMLTQLGPVSGIKILKKKNLQYQNLLTECVNS